MEDELSTMATNAWSNASADRDPADRVAAVAQKKRELLLSVNRAKLPREELEDCFAQATLELVVRARRAPFESDAHAANALEQKFASRITDRVRAISGRSPKAAMLRGAASLDADREDDTPLVVVDRVARVEQQALARHELRALRELAAELTDDQRLVLACQVSLGMDCAEFCERYGWSAEKFRKVAQRARAKLRSLMDAHDQGERCRALEPALLAVASRIADAGQSATVQAHLESCLGCARSLRDLRAAERGVAAVSPLPAVLKLGLLAKAGAAVVALRRLLPFGRDAPPPHRLARGLRSRVRVLTRPPNACGRGLSSPGPAQAPSANSTRRRRPQLIRRSRRPPRLRRRPHPRRLPRRSSLQ